MALQQIRKTRGECSTDSEQPHDGVGPPKQAVATEQATAETQTSQEEREACPECSTSLSTEHCGEYAERYCPECGLVVETDAMDYGKEWREFDDSNGPSRGVSKRDEMAHDYGLGSNIGTQRTLDSQQMHRMRQLDKQSKVSGGDRSLVNAFTEIRTVVSQLGYSRSLAERAGRLFRSAQAEDVFSAGNVREVYVGATVYTACREAEKPVVPDQIITYLSIDDGDVQGDVSVETVLLRTYRELCAELGVEPTLLTPSDYLPFLIGRLPSKFDMLENPARELVNAVEDQQWTVGRNPRSVAAGAVWLAGHACCDHPPTQPVVADAVDLSACPLRNVKDEILERACAQVGDDIATIITGLQVQESMDDLDQDDAPNSLTKRAVEVLQDSQDVSALAEEHTEAKRAAVIYMVCREMDVSILPSQVAARIDEGESVTGRDIQRISDRLCSELEIDALQPTAREYIPQIVAGLPDGLANLEQPAIAIARAVSHRGWSSDRKPQSIAAGAVYVAGQALCKRPPTQSTIGEVAGITARTVRTVKSEILDDGPELTTVLETNATGPRPSMPLKAENPGPSQLTLSDLATVS